MGYRGEDAARERAAWGAQSPRQSSGEHAAYDGADYSNAGYDGADYNSTDYNGSDYGSAGYNGGGYAGTSYGTYGQGDGYGQGDSYGPASYDSGSYSNTGGFGANTGGFGANTGGFGTGGHASDGYETGGSYNTGNYSGTASHGSGGYPSGGGYGSGGYPAGDYGSDDSSGSSYGGGSYGESSHGGGPASHGSGAYQSAPYDSSYDSYGGVSYSGDSYSESSHGGDSYGGSSYGSSRASGGYPALGQSSSASGGYPTLGQSSRASGSYPALGQSSSASGGYPALGSSSRASGGYPAISGGYPATGHPSGGYPALGDISYDDGNDWYGRSGPQPTGGFADTSAQLAVRDPIRGYPPEAARADDGLAHTGQQLRYDDSEHVTYPGYDGVEDGYGKDNRGYDYDDYAGYETAAGNQPGRRRTGQQEFDTRLDQVAVDYDSLGAGSRGYDKTRRYGQALQGDDFDGGRYHDDYADANDDFLAGPGTGPRRGLPGGRGVDERSPSGPISPAQNGSRQAGGGKKRRRTWLYATVAVVLVLAAGGAYKFMLSGQDNAAKEANQPLPSTTASAGTQLCATPQNPFCHIETRTDDPTPLTLSELYLPRFHSQADNQDFILQSEKIDTNCASALFGSELISQVQTGKCTQVLRASYLSSDQTIMGTIGVVNLISTNQAHYAGKIIGQSDFIQPLSTSTGLTAKLGKGVGVVQAHYKGHYLILTWAQLTSLKTPTTAQTQQLEAWENALMNGTANIYLSQRMVNGDGSATGASAAPSASGSARPSASASATH